MNKFAIIKEELNKYYDKLLKESIIQENAKLYYTPEKNGKRWVIIMSNKTNPVLRNKETAKIGALLNLKKGNETFFKNRYDFSKPIRYYNERTGDFGWGYEFSSNIPGSEVESMIKNLKTLIHDYNAKPDVNEPFDLETERLNPEQIKILGQVVKIVQDAIEVNSDNPNPIVEESLNLFYKELKEAIQKDEVYEFLSDALTKASNFQKKNTFYPYEFENSLIIRFADPSATFAAPKSKWQSEGYKIKKEFEGGIIIKKGSGSYDTNIDKFKSNENTLNSWEEYKRLKNLPANLTLDEFKKTATKNEKYDLVSWGFNNKIIYKSSFYNKYGNNIAYVYTDTMIEPIEGANPTELNFDDDFGIKEEPIQTLETKEKIDKLFAVLLKIAEKSRIPSLGNQFINGDINKFNELLNKITYNKISYWFKRNGLIPENKPQKETEEMLKAFSEAASFIVKKQFNLPTETNKYKAALYGLDPEISEDQNKQVIITAHYIIRDINQELKTNNLNEIKKAVKNIILEFLS